MSPLPRGKTPAGNIAKQRRTARAAILLLSLKLERNERDYRGGCLRDARGTVEQRHIVALRPQRREIAIMRRLRMGGLAPRIDARAVVPGAHVHNQAHGWAGGGTERACAIGA